MINKVPLAPLTVLGSIAYLPTGWVDTTGE